eukprot:366747_1
MNEIEKLKEQGNSAFQVGDLDAASRIYTAAIEMVSELPETEECCLAHVLYSNRSAVWAAQDLWEKSEADAEQAVKLEPNFIKAYARLAYSQLMLNKVENVAETARIGEEMAAAGMQQSGQIIPTGLTELRRYAKQAEDMSKGIYSNEFMSTRYYNSLSELGTGNFSTVLLVKHKNSNFFFALKVIDKEEAKRISRRHPNVYNEIKMEKNALNKLRGHPGIVQLYTTFQDFGSLYYLLELCPGDDLYSAMLENDRPVGAHRSLAVFWFAELVLTIEHMHMHGIVHRDLKPENIMLTETGHIKVIDFGTCKDLQCTELNGPEFVGTPQYMSPQALDNEVQGREADLWALGICLYQFLCGGVTPFHAPSPYLCFLRISSGVIHWPYTLGGHAQALIKSLLMREPHERLGSDATGGFESLKSHPFFSTEGQVWNTVFEKAAVKIPRLSELSLRAFGHALVNYADATPILPVPLPSHMDLNSARVNALKERDRAELWQYVAQSGLLTQSHVMRLLMGSVSESRFKKADSVLREYVGLDWDREGEWNGDFFFVHMTDIQLGFHVKYGKRDDSAGDFEPEASRIRQCVTHINRIRPRFVIITGDIVHGAPGTSTQIEQISKVCHILSRVSETIPVLFCPGNHEVNSPPPQQQTDGDDDPHKVEETFMSAINNYQQHFGADYYAFWCGGMRGIVLNTQLLVNPSAAPHRAEAQERWAMLEMSLAELNSHHLVVFQHHPWFQNAINEEPNSICSPIPTCIRIHWLARMAYCKVKVIFAGHLHFPSVNNIDRVAVIEKARTMGLDMSGIVKDQEKEADWTEEETSCMRQIVTESLADPVHSNNPGMTVVRVGKDNIESQFYPLDDFPKTVST